MRSFPFRVVRSHLSTHVFTVLFALTLLGFSSFAFGDPIHSATEKGDLTKVKALIAQDPGLVSSKDKMGMTPLHLAAKNDHKDVAEFLVASGADVNAKDSNGAFTPLDLALSSYHYMDVVTLLIDKGADVNARSGQGLSALMETAMRGQKDAAALLLAKGADVNAVDSKGNTALLWALLMGHMDFVKVLVDANADVNAKNGQGMTPLALAKRRDDINLTDLLRQHGAHD